MVRLCFILFLLFFSSPVLHAQEFESFLLEIDSQFLSKICTPSIWNNLPVVWKGVQDKRIQKEIGVETLRNKNPSYLISKPDLETLFNETLKIFFTKCGIRFIQSKNGDEIELSAEIEEFYATVNRKLITGKGNAKSKIRFLAVRPDQKKGIEVGYELESKDTRQKSLRQLKEMLNELFKKTFEQIAQTKQLKEL